MTKETRTFLIQFISRADKNNELTRLETEILDFFREYSEDEKCKNEKKNILKNILKLEENFLKYADLIKYQYFNYGMLAQDLESNYSLSFAPSELKEVMSLDD